MGEIIEQITKAAPKIAVFITKILTRDD